MHLFSYVLFYVFTSHSRRYLLTGLCEKFFSKTAHDNFYVVHLTRDLNTIV